MKKVSTAATKQSRNISRQRLTIGLDLGDRNSWYCVLDEVGQIRLEQRVRTTGKALQEVFSTMPRSRVALEIGTHSPWISRLLSELGHEVIVANARKVRLIGEVKTVQEEESQKAQSRVPVTALMAWPRFHSRRAEPQGANQMAAPAVTRTPNLHRANKIAPRECGWKHGDSGYSAGERKLVQ